MKLPDISSEAHDEDPIWIGVQDLRAALKAMREASGLSKSALGRKLGLSHTSISTVEQGDRSPKLGLVKRWAAACGKSTHLMFGRTGPKPRNAHLLVNAIELAHLSEDEIGSLSHLVVNLLNADADTHRWVFDQVRALSDLLGIGQDL